MAAVMLVFMLPLALLLAGVWKMTGGHFTYTLDDPYIHLALARNIWLGNYGINLVEPSAPSSSIIWPFLLAPLSSRAGTFELLPFLINAAALIFTGARLTKIFSDMGPKKSLLVALTFALAFNLFGLVFTGLEHSVQVLLVVLIAEGFLRSHDFSKAHTLGGLFWGSLFLLPLVRYEGLAITVPVFFYLAYRGQMRRAALIGLASMTTVAAFSAYLYTKGLGFLPSSILAKSAGLGMSGVMANVRDNIKEHGWVLWIVAMYVGAVWQSNRGRAVLLSAISLLHLFFGRYGWYGRYEVYYVLFIALIIFEDVRHVWPQRWPVVFAMPLAFSNLLYATISTPMAASNIYNTQVQMAAMVEQLGSRVAVNDLGLVALRGNTYVLDLWGLGSMEALTLRKKSPGDGGWMDTLMKRKGVEYAMVYDTWFDHRPASWIKVAELHLNQHAVTVGGTVVSFYATNATAANEMKKVVAAYQETHPSRDFLLVLSRDIKGARLSQAEL